MSWLVSCQDLGLALGQLGKEGCRGLPTSTWRMFPILSWRAWFFPKYLSVSLMKDPQQAYAICRCLRKEWAVHPRMVFFMALIHQKLV